MVELELESWVGWRLELEGWVLVVGFVSDVEERGGGGEGVEEEAEIWAMP